MVHRFVLLLLRALICAQFVVGVPNDPTHAADSTMVLAQSTVTEKEAYEAAKELGTIEAWEAFLNSFPKGFRADLARAYLKRIASETPKQTPAATPPPPPVVVAVPPPPPPAPADISLAVTSQGACAGGQSCSVTVTATNTGGQLFSRPLTIATSVAPGGAALQGTGTPPFSCQDMGGGAVCSQGSTDIAPGQSMTLPLVFTLPRNAGGQVTACASIAWGGVPAVLGPIEVQRKLNELGFNAGAVDGQPGRKTVKAIKAYQASAGLQQTGEMDLPLLLSLFEHPGEGDANPNNDQACAGSAVTVAAPPAAFTPPAAPAWQPPRGYGKINRKAKPQKCSSRSVWVEGQCILKSAVASFCGPGFRRQGSRCVSNAPTPPPQTTFGGTQQLGCPANTTRTGNNCVQLNLAPLFNLGKKQKGDGQQQKQKAGPSQTGIGQPVLTNKPSGGGQAAAPPPIVKQTKPSANSMPGDWKLAVGGKCPAGKELINWAGRQICANKQSCPPGQKLIRYAGVHHCATPAQIAAQNAKSKSYCDNFSRCAYPSLSRACPAPLIKAEGLCLCPKRNQRWNGKTCVAAGGGQQQAAPPPVVKPAGGTCPIGVATNLNCRCPAGTTSQKLSVGGRAGQATGQICTRTGGGQVKPKPAPAAPKILTKCNGGQVVGTSCRCPAGQTAKLQNTRKNAAGTTFRTFNCVSQGIKCGPGMRPQGNKCVSIRKPGSTTSKQIYCQPGTGLVPRNGKCACPSGKKWNGRVCAAQQQQFQQPRPQPQPRPQALSVCGPGQASSVGGKPTCRCPAPLRSCPSGQVTLCKTAC